MIEKAHNFLVNLLSCFIIEKRIRKKFKKFFLVTQRKKGNKTQIYTENLAYNMRENMLKYSYMGENCYIYHPETKIGKYTSIAHNVIIGAGQHPLHWLSTHPFAWQGYNFMLKNKINRINWQAYKPVIVGNDVWIGINTVIMDGVKIGDGAVIAANAVVTKDIPPYQVWGGVPAKFIKQRFDDTTIEELVSLKWWDLDNEMLCDLPYNNIDECIKKIKERL